MNNTEQKRKNDRKKLKYEKKHLLAHNSKNKSALNKYTVLYYIWEYSIDDNPYLKLW